jgi:3-deoxy-D-manno-octulosonic-acid transferase
MRSGSLWVHAASVGEVAAVSPLVRALSETPHGVFLTAVTATGRRAAENSDADRSSFAPLDFVPAVRRALGIVRPRALLLTETELWPNTITECLNAGAPAGVVNGRLSSGSLRRYLLPGSPVKEPVSRLTFAACRTEEDAERFVSLGTDPSRVRVVGDMKFDKLDRPLDEEARDELRRALGVPDDAVVVVFGSVRPREEPAVARATREIVDSDPGSFVVLAPRHMDRVASLTGELSSLGLSPRRRSDGQSSRPGARTLMLDTTGELTRVYSLGKVAFVGGTLAPYGGHDPLEPAAQGVPVVLGRHTESCRDSAEKLVRAGGAFVVQRPEELAATIVGLLRGRAELAAAGRRALETVAAGRGATRRTMDLLSSMGIIDADGE